ncbi:CAP domain-containing protein [Streptomyces verrucosisporus]|uniref:CAP domain-containing protein n=1 Tax=Streptomyces verrucosisporus TaxID=1695161 RepID=UPI0019D271D1|nr:CAP domain-containing protein [Streptomyces verrucosisporus]MBN3930912.1 CAP domain-containing protein [Streptomyces verrucosisporus]
MGRHRRAEPVPAPAPVTSDRHAAGGRHRGPHRRRSAVPVRTGLLGASAAMAMGAVAVASGLLPGPNGDYTVGGFASPSGVAPDDLRDLRTQGAATPAPDDRGEGPAAGPGDGRTASPDPGASRGQEPEKPEATPSEKSAEPTPSRGSTPPAGKDGAGDDAVRESSGSPGEPSASSRKPTAPGLPSLDEETAAEAEVLRLVNLERAEAGCRPVTADPELARLAEDFSRDMAAREFFSHTGPDGETPWDRAEAAGIDNLGGENIARGQADAQAVMDAWMDSPGHRANILNCDYRTLGVGAHFAEGGPWWTQNFGF